MIPGRIRKAALRVFAIQSVLLFCSSLGAQNQTSNTSPPVPTTKVLAIGAVETALSLTRESRSCPVKSPKPWSYPKGKIDQWYVRISSVGGIVQAHHRLVALRLEPRGFAFPRSLATSLRAADLGLYVVEASLPHSLELIWSSIPNHHNSKIGDRMGDSKEPDLMAYFGRSPMPTQ